MEIARPTREELIHRLYEAAELEHNLMCTYLYAAGNQSRAAPPAAPGGSRVDRGGNKPFCDGTHARIGFRSSDT